MGGGGRDDHMELRFLVFLSGGGIYRILALLWILMFDFFHDSILLPSNIPKSFFGCMVNF